MEINADFGRRAAVHTAHQPWIASPVAGVERKMLERIGGEVARATSVVRYAPGSRFSPHVHGGGEEFLVLDGVFQDERGDYPAGAYVRNAPRSRHTPGSATGCTILVKLWQFQGDDRLSIHINTSDKPFAAVSNYGGVARQALYRDDYEDVRLERWVGGARIAAGVPGGIEIFVLGGAFVESGERFDRQSWLRLPPGQPMEATVMSEGALVWVKSGHLEGLSVETVRHRLATAAR